MQQKRGNSGRYEDMEKVHNSEDLAYFISLQSLGASDDGGYSREKWDRRAEHWQRETIMI